MADFFKGFRRLFVEVPVGYRMHYLAYTLMTILHCFAFVVLPFLYAELVERVKQGLPYQQEWVYYVAITVGALFLMRLWSFTNTYFSAFAQRVLAKKLFRSSLDAENKDTTVFLKDLETCSQLFLDFVYTLPGEATVMVAILGIVLYYSPPIFLFQLCFLVVVWGITLFREKKIVPLYYRSQKLYYALFDRTSDLCHGATEITLQQAQGWAKGKMQSALQTYAEVLDQYTRQSHGVDGCMEGVSHILYLGTVLAALWLYTNQQVSLAVCMVLIQFSGVIQGKFQYLYGNFNYLMDFTPHLDRLLQRLQERKIEIQNRTPLTGEKEILLSVSKLCYAPLFQDLSFTVKKGEMVAITGRSGVGKTTLFQILCNAIPKDAGEIGLREGTRVSVLEQFPYVFQRTVEENLFMEEQNHLDEAILGSPLQAQASSLSGGEKARLGFVRATLPDSDLLLLDEPLTGVDIATQRRILATLKNKTCLMITHQQELLQYADRIIEIPSLVHPTTETEEKEEAVLAKGGTYDKR